MRWGTWVCGDEDLGMWGWGQGDMGMGLVVLLAPVEI